MIYFAAIGGVLLVGLVLFAPWQIWGPVLALALIAVAFLLIRAFRQRRSNIPPEPSPRYAPSPPPVKHREQKVERVSLPSKEEDYDFLFSATVLWSPLAFTTDEDKVNAAALAVNAILKRAEEITRQREPGRASLVQHELGGILGTMQADDTRCVQAMAESVEVTLPAHDQERLEKLARIRKKEAVWEHERKYEQNKREYLGEDVLKDTGSAVVWWLARNDEHVEKAVNDIGLLTRLSFAANNKELPEGFRHLQSDTDSDDLPEASRLPFGNGASAVDCFTAFLHKLDFKEEDSQSTLFAHEVATLVGKHGRPEVADEIMLRFDTEASPFGPLPDPPTDWPNDVPEETGQD
ncbi:hypothetical protein ACFQVD_07500 [Streptosporangium amethystogenes subsp. fukuiense]|uniref:Secreted protein n=1 Tax=Streptosporangium amethystogenes subsp. fukuiense TaxID=698418 RepID=A0ABW2SWB3_9ACTN